MTHRRFIIEIIRSLLTGTLLLLLLEGCASSSSQRIPATPDPSANQNLMPAPTKIYGPYITVPSLLTIFTDASSIFLNDGYCRGPILATDRLTYTRAELQEMDNYLKNPYGKHVSIPKTIKWLDGAPTTSNPAFSSKSIYMPQIQSCGTVWEMTNIGQKPIQLMQVHMKLLADTAEADRQYRLFDPCSITEELYPSVGNECGIGGRPASSSYSFSFGPGKAGSVIEGKSLEGEPVIPPGETLFLELGFLPANTSDALTYTIEPEFVINTSEETGKVIDISQWQETFVMAPSDHFGCYILKGNTFVPAISVPVRGSTNCL